MKNKLVLLKIFSAATVLLLLVASSAAADFSLRDWQYFKAIILPQGLQGEELVEVAPDTQVFSMAAHLNDLRIISNNNEEVPYKLDISQAQHQRTSFPVTLQDNGYVPGSYNIFTVDLGQAGILHNEIEVRTTSMNFRRTATVETCNDHATWMKIAQQTIYDFTVKERNFTTRNTSIHYPDGTARYVRVTIIDDGEGALKITGATVFFVKDTPAREILWPATILNTSRDDDTTRVEIDLGTAGLPSNRLAINVLDVNFYRYASLEASTDRQTWSTILPRGAIYSYDTPKFVGNSLSLAYPETTSRYLRLIIQDEDSPPLTIQKVNVLGLWRRLVFVANPESSYQLFYGNSNAARPSYDIERIFPYLMTDVLTEASLGPQNNNPDFVEKKPPLSERFPWLFPVVLAVAAIIVALLLIGIFRQVRKSLPPPPKP